MRNNNLAFIDIETTGLNILRHEIIEIGCVIATPLLEVIEEFDIKIKPGRIEDADPTSLKVNHYKEEDWADAISLKEGLQILSEKAKDCIMVGHNVSFDIEFLDCAFSRTNVPNTLHYHRLDTMSIAWACL